MLLDGNIDDKTDAKSLLDSPSGAWWIGAGVCLFPVWLLFSVFGGSGKGTATICFGGAMIAVVRLRWKLKNRIWFWVSVIALALLHTALIVFIPWPNKDYPLPIVLALGVSDALLISFLIQLVAKKMGPSDNKADDLPSTF